MPPCRHVFGQLIALIGLSFLSACHPTPPAGCTYVVAPAATPMTASGSNVRVLVTTAPSCTWSYQGNVPWITVGPDADSTGQAGTGNGAVVLTAAANSGATHRSGTATIATQTITVDQAGTAGSGCTFQVSPSTQTFTGGTAGTGQFTITASAPDCGWTATRTSNLEDTVNLTGGGNGGAREDRFGVGSSTITYQVKALSPTSPWPSGGGDIKVTDSAQQVAATHHVALP
jgi:hypothetical protein